MVFLEGRGVIVALDTWDLELIEKIVGATSNIDGVAGYKIGLMASLTHGLKKTVKTIRRITSKPIIYDHQKAMTDTPHIGEGFARIMRVSGVDAAIGFPHSGPRVLISWVEALRRECVLPIIGGEMTHDGFLRSEGGYICDDAPLSIYMASSDLGVEHYVLPASKIARALKYAEIISARVNNPVFLLPGVGLDGEIDPLLSQMISSYRNVHLILGRALMRRDLSRDHVERIIRRLGLR